MLVDLKKIAFTAASFSLAFCVACSDSSNSVIEDIDDEDYGSSSSRKKVSSSSAEISSSSIAADTSTVDSVAGYDFVKIPAQTFMRVNTEVVVSAFEMLSTEVTQGMYSEFLKLPEQKMYDANLPVANVTWYDAVRFCNAASKKMGLDTAYSYSAVGAKGVLLDLAENLSVKSIRLPTEAEWEVAARAGTTTKFYWGTMEAKDYANYLAAGSSQAVAVASLLPNAYGLYDMSGNVAEWVNDWYSAYLDEKKLDNPTGPKEGVTRVHRGGSYASSTKELASGERAYADPAVASPYRGFRMVRR